MIRFEITDRIVMHNEPCACGNSKPWLTLEGGTDDILAFENGVGKSPLSLYAALKEVHETERFQRIQQKNNRLELRLISANKQPAFANAKQAVESFLMKNDVVAEAFPSDKLPEANPVSGKFKHNNPIAK